MNLTADITVLSVNARESNHVEVEQVITIYADDKPIGRIPHTYVIAPDDDIDRRNDRAAAIAKVVRTKSPREGSISIPAKQTR